MQSDTQIILLIIFAFFAFLYFNRVIKKSNEAKAQAMDRAREIEAQAAAMHKMALDKIYQEQNIQLSAKRFNEMEKPIPHYIQKALSKFESDYKSNSSSFK